MKKTDIVPMTGYVLVEPYEKPTETGGLILAGDQQNSAPIRGTVIQIPETGSPFVIGDNIFFRKYAVDELKFINEDSKEETIFLIDIREVLAVFRGETEEVEVNAAEVKELAREGDDKLRKSIWKK